MKGILYALAVAVLLLSFATAFQFWHEFDAKRSAKSQTCQAFTKFDVWVVNQTKQAEKLAAGLAYYRDHPNDLVKVLAADEQSLTTLRASLPDYC